MGWLSSPFRGGRSSKRMGPRNVSRSAAVLSRLSVMSLAANVKREALPLPCCASSIARVSSRDSACHAGKAARQNKTNKKDGEGEGCQDYEQKLCTVSPPRLHSWLLNAHRHSYGREGGSIAHHLEERSRLPQKRGIWMRFISDFYERSELTSPPAWQRACE